MLDIIIPTYKNKDELRRTLSSINKKLLSELTVTVIDDCSDMHYDDIVKEFPFIRMLYNKVNCGPGLTRENGIQFTTEPYIMFIDTGDYFASDEIQKQIIITLQEQPDYVMYFWQYKMNDKISTNTSNRLHGRVYKRDFLQKYDIHFCKNCSFTNEDIGFNRTCRLIAKDKKLKIFTDDTPAIIYTFNENSLTHRNQGEFFFKQQNLGLALNTIQEIQTAEKNKVSKQLILEEINTIMASLYYTFLCTAYERNEFLQEAWNGAKLFYIMIFIPYTKINNTALVMNGYNIFVKRIYVRARNWKNFQPLNYSRFLTDLKNYKEPPYYYNFI